MNPVTGPFPYTEVGPYHNLNAVRYRQAKPYNLPLAYRMERAAGWRSSKGRSLYGGEYESTREKAVSWSFLNMSEADRHYNAAYNHAYAKFQGQISDSAGWGENLAQFNKAREMFNSRAWQLWQFTRNMRQGRFGDAARYLRTNVPSRVSHSRALSANILEFEYGLKPLMSDIKSSAEILTSDPHPKQVKASSFDYWRDYYPSSGPGYVSRGEATCKLFVTIRSGVRVTNPNLFLAVRLGLLDVALPWKLLPFSFVVDWFVNVEQMFSSMTDLYGLELDNPHYTWKALCRATGYERTDWQEFNPETGGFFGSFVQHDTVIQTVELHRVLGLPGPSLVVKPFKGFSMQRGIQAIALVLGVLGSGEIDHKSFWGVNVPRPRK